MTEPMKIAIAGLGTVGAGTVKLIQSHGDLLARRCGRAIEIVAVSARNRDRDRGVALDNYTFFDDAVAMAKDAPADVIVELIGGADGVAKDVALAALAGLANYGADETLVTTLMSNMGVELALHPKGIHVLRTQVGDRYVLEKMIKGAYNLGGEQSGHMIFLDYNTTGDGVVTALQFLSLMIRTGKPVSELVACMSPLPQILKNVKVSSKPALSTLPELTKQISEFEKQLEGRGRILVRYSGTEALLRVMIEGEAHEAIAEMADSLIEIIEKKIGANK